MKQNEDLEHQVTADVGAQRVARVYAEALLNAAEKHGQADEVLDELKSLVGDLFQADPQLEAFLVSASIGRNHKAEVIQKAFENRASDLFLDFLLVLNQHERLNLLRPILAAAQEIHDQRARRIRVGVRSAVELTGEQQERLREELRKTWQLEPLLKLNVDPELLGGIVVRVGDWLYDGSVSTRLETIRNQLIARSTHEIQSGRDRFSSPSGN